MENCIVFRTSDHRFVQSELKEGRLRQGWSPSGTSLLDANGGERGAEDWSQAYRDAWGKDPSPRRYSILRRMLDMNEGDLVICPKAPDYQHFTIARVCETYRFEVAAGQKDFGHVIPIKDQHVVSNWHSQDSQTICALFRSQMLPLTWTLGGLIGSVSFFSRWPGHQGMRRPPAVPGVG